MIQFDGENERINNAYLKAKLYDKEVSSYNKWKCIIKSESFTLRSNIINLLKDALVYSWVVLLNLLNIYINHKNKSIINGMLTK